MNQRSVFCVLDASLFDPFLDFSVIFLITRPSHKLLYLHKREFSVFMFVLLDKIAYYNRRLFDNLSGKAEKSAGYLCWYRS